MGKTYFESGTWNQECAESGKLVKANQLVKRYDGAYVLPEHDEPDPDKLFGTPNTMITGRPARTILKTSKNAMDNQFDEDDGIIVFENDQVVNPNQP